MKRALRTGARPPPMKLRPRHWPDWACPGRGPRQSGDLALAEAAELGHFGDQRPGNGLADAGDGGEELLVLHPKLTTADLAIDVLIDDAELLLKRCQQPFNASFEALWRAFEALAFVLLADGTILLAVCAPAPERLSQARPNSSPASDSYRAAFSRLTWRPLWAMSAYRCSANLERPFCRDRPVDTGGRVSSSWRWNDPLGPIVHELPGSARRAQEAGPDQPPYRLGTGIK